MARRVSSYKPMRNNNDSTYRHNVTIVYTNKKSPFKSHVTHTAPMTMHKSEIQLSCILISAIDSST